VRLDAAGVADARADELADEVPVEAELVGQAIDGGDITTAANDLGRRRPASAASAPSPEVAVR
jgi:hypothetical protein